MVQQRDGGSVTGQFMFQLDNGTPYYYDYNSGFGVQARASAKCNDGQWRHLVAVRTPTRVKMYVDGKLSRDMSARPKQILSSRTFAVGCDYRGDRGITKWGLFKGLIDEVAIFKKALSEKEILSLYEHQLNRN